jgi:hypothetical protein
MKDPGERIIEAIGEMVGSDAVSTEEAYSALRDINAYVEPWIDQLSDDLQKGQRDGGNHRGP